MSLRDRLLTPRVAKAMTSSSGILAAGAGAAAGIALGAPIAAAVGIGAAAWATRVALAVPRRQRHDRIDPFTVKEPWRHYVSDALQAEQRFDEAVDAMRSGPLKDRLTRTGDRISQGVRDVWQVAQRGHALDRARSQIDDKTARRELEEVEKDAGERWAAGSDLEAAADALRAQISSADRMDRTRADALDRLRLLDARLDEAVARTIEFSIGPGDDVALGVLTNTVDEVVTEMEALRLALEDTSTP